MIKLGEIKIKNFRSIKDLSFLCSDIIAFVGYNNAGKSNCLRAIRWALSMEKLDENDFCQLSQDDPEVEFNLKDVTLDKVERLVINDDKKISKIEEMIVDGEIRLKIRATKVDGKIEQKLYYYKNGDWKPNPAGVSNALRCIVPEVFSLSAKSNSEEQTSKIKSGTLFSKLMGVYVENEIQKGIQGRLESILKEIAEDESIKKLSEDVGSSLSEFYSDIDVSILPSLKSEDVYKSFTLQLSSKGGQNMGVGEFGHGLQRSAELAFLNCVANQRSLIVRDKSIVLLIDEPEIFQHPSLINKIRQVLIKLSTIGYQVALTTHSPNMLQSREILSHLHIVYSDRVEGTKFRNREFVDLNRAQANDAAVNTVMMLNQLAYLPFCECAVLVEGETERIIFPELLGDLFPFTCHRFCIVDVGGCTQFPYVKDILDQFNIRALLIADLDGVSKIVRSDLSDDLNDRIKKISNNFEGYFKTKSEAIKRSAEDYWKLCQEMPDLVNASIRELEGCSILVWRQADIEHTLYPALVAKKMKKSKMARYVIDQKNAFVKEGGCEPIDSWKRVIEEFGGDWSNLVHFSSILSKNISASSEVQDLKG